MMSTYAHSMFNLLLVLVNYHVVDTTGSSGLSRWPNAEQVIRAMCPYSKICNVEPTKIGPSDTCCTGMFSQGLTTSVIVAKTASTSINAVFVITTIRNTRHVSTFDPSLTTSSHFPVLKGRSIPTMSSPSPLMLAVTKIKGNVSPGTQRRFTQFFSEANSKVYFNKECAICHGVKKVIEPEIYFFCDGLGMAESVDFDVELSKFLEGDKSSLCFLEYSFPSVADNRLCSIHAQNSIENFINITNQDNLRNSYNMSIEDIADACLNSFYSPTLRASKARLYPNPFCYLYGEGTHERDPCLASTGNPSGIEFLALLNPKIKAILPLASERKKRNFDQVCVKTTDTSSSYQYERCRPLSCPIGHIFYEDAGCVFFGTKLFNDGRMNIFLTLILKNAFDVSISRSDLMNMSIDVLSRSLQLPEEWSISFWGISTDSPKQEQQDKREIIVTLQMASTDLARSIEVFKQHMYKEVVVLNSTFKLTMYGKILIMEDVLPEDLLATTQCSATKDKPEYSRIEDDVPDCWKITGVGLNLFRAITVESVNKLYFCDVVELMSDEYRILANGSLLFNEINRKYLYKKEFLVQQNENDKKIVKVCLEDSGFNRFKVNNSVNANEPSLLLLVPICFSCFVPIKRVTL